MLDTFSKSSGSTVRFYQWKRGSVQDDSDLLAVQLGFLRSACRIRCYAHFSGPLGRNTACPDTCLDERLSRLYKQRPLQSVSKTNGPRKNAYDRKRDEK